MELVIHAVKDEQVALFEELAKVLGLQLEKRNSPEDKSSERNKVDWDEDMLE
jgi:hypothetical protein